jgi:hypothetical protein
VKIYKRFGINSNDLLELVFSYDLVLPVAQLPTIRHTYSEVRMSNKYDWITKELLERDYRELGSFKLIAEKYDVWPSTIIYYCKKFDVKTTPKIRYSCNEYIFSADTEESFYLAGFIAADGCIVQHKSNVPNCISICLAKKDEGHLLKLKNLLQFTGPIKTSVAKHSKINTNWNDVQQCKIDIYSKQMINDLKRFGIGPQKSLTYAMPNWIINHPLVHHFMRGYNDGDGSFYINKEKRMTKKFGIRECTKFVFSLRGTNEFLISYHLILLRKANLFSTTTPKFNNGIDMLRFSGNGQVKKIVEFLYNNAHIYLDRKFDMVKGLI